MDKIATVDEFVEKKVLPEFHPVVAMIRSLTREFAPKAREMISYGIPANKVKRMIAVISPTKKIKRMAGANMDALLISLLDDVLFFFYHGEGTPALAGGARADSLDSLGDLRTLGG